MTENEFRKRAEEMGYSDEIINEIIYRHNTDEFVLPYEAELIGVIDNYPNGTYE